MHPARFQHRRLRRAVTLAEILVVVAIIGVLTAIAIPTYSNVRDSAVKTQATDRMEELNRAVKLYAGACFEPNTAAQASSSADELLVLRSIQYGWPGSFKPGVPYYTQKWNPSGSSSSKDWRIRWNGRTFEMLEPGVSGTGLLLRFDGLDLNSAPYTYPENYKPEGMP